MSGQEYVWTLVEEAEDKMECRGWMWSGWHFKKIFMMATVEVSWEEAMLTTEDKLTASCATSKLCYKYTYIYK